MATPLEVVIAILYWGIGLVFMPHCNLSWMVVLTDFKPQIAPESVTPSHLKPPVFEGKFNAFIRELHTEISQFRLIYAPLSRIAVDGRSVASKPAMDFHYP